MIERWRRRESVPLAPADKPGGGREEDIIDVVPTIDPTTGRELYVPEERAIHALPKPETAQSANVEGVSFRERPKGKAEKAYKKDLFDSVSSFGAGDARLEDRTGFEEALAKYADIRTRRSREEALLGAKMSIDQRDADEFQRRTEALDVHLVSSGFLRSGEGTAATKPETAKKKEKTDAPKPDASDTKHEDLDINAVFEKLKNMGERKDDAPTDDADTVPSSFERGYKVFEDIRRSGVPQEDQIPLASRGIISNADYPKFKAYVEEKLAAVERGKNAAKKERRERRRNEAVDTPPAETAAERQERLKSAAKIFFDRVEKGADATFMYQIAENSLPQADIADFKGFLEQLGAHINGTSGKDMPAFVEAASSHKEAKEMLGRPDGSVGDVPYWNLPGKTAAIFDRPSAGFQKYFLTIKEGGVHRFPGGWHEYRDGAFHAIDEETVLARRERPASAQRQERDTAAVEETPRPAQEERTDVRNEGSDAPSLESAKKSFFRKYNREKKKAGKAFREATERLDTEEKEELLEYLRDTTDIPKGILDGIAANLKHEDKERGGGNKREQRLEREIEEDIAAIGGKRSAESVPREARRGRESAQERLNREIEEDIAKVLAKK